MSTVLEYAVADTAADAATRAPGRSARLAYSLTGPHDAPVILALGGISASCHVSNETSTEAGWWGDVAGPQRALDTTRYRLLGIEYLDGGRNQQGRPARIVRTAEQADAIVALLDALGIAELHAVIGASYGGMVALALAAQAPERVRSLVVISAPDRPHPMTTALRALQRQVVELGLDTSRASDAMTIARGIAMTTYRSAREFGERFDQTARKSGETISFDVEQYLEAAGRKFARRMSPERFLALSLSADLHAVTPANVTAPTTVIAAEGDTLVHEAQLERLAASLPNLRAYHVLATQFGHDAFLTEPAAVSRLLTASLQD